MENESASDFQFTTYTHTSWHTAEHHLKAVFREMLIDITKPKKKTVCLLDYIKLNVILLPKELFTIS